MKQRQDNPAGHSEPARLELQGVTVAYGREMVLQNVTLHVPHGARVALVGPNGAGKSTLFKALVGLLPLRRGRVLIHGEQPAHSRDCIAYLPQREEIDWRFPVTVADVVMMGRYGRLGWLKRPGKQDRTVVESSLEKMGVLHLAQRRIGELSGGQQQRVFLARALAQEPHILLMDEPFAGVDAGTQETTLALLDELQKQKVTVVVSTHDLNMASQRFGQVALLNRRLIAFGSAAEVFTPAAVAEAFGGQVLFLEGAMVVDQCCPCPADQSKARIGR